MDNSPSETIERLVTRLRTLRKLCGWTQAEVSKMSGIKRDIITNIETGRKRPSLEDALRLAAIYDQPLSQLLSAEPLRMQREVAVL